MTDNGSCYKSNAFRDLCRERGLKHIRTSRAAELPTWLHRYNWHRPHGGISSQTPISRLGLDQHNLLSLHS